MYVNQGKIIIIIFFFAEPVQDVLKLVLNFQNSKKTFHTLFKCT